MSSIALSIMQSYTIVKLKYFFGAKCAMDEADY